MVGLEPSRDASLAYTSLCVNQGAVGFRNRLVPTAGSFFVAPSPLMKSFFFHSFKHGFVELVALFSDLQSSSLGSCAGCHGLCPGWPETVPKPWNEDGGGEQLGVQDFQTLLLVTGLNLANKVCTLPESLRAPQAMLQQCGRVGSGINRHSATVRLSGFSRSYG